MARKTSDLCVVLSRYTDNSGREKIRYQHIGAELVNDEGKSFIILNPWVSLAGLPVDPSHNSVFVCKFAPRSMAERKGSFEMDESSINPQGG